MKKALERPAPRRADTTARQYVSERQLQDLTGISHRTWQTWRLLGKGPRWYRLGAAIRYELGECLAWIESRACGGTGRAA